MSSAKSTMLKLLDSTIMGQIHTRAQKSAYSESRTISPRRQRRSRSPRHNPTSSLVRRERTRFPRHEYKSKAMKGKYHVKRLEAETEHNPRHLPIAVRKAQVSKNHSESEDREGGTEI
ncbi:hypothetical protein Tco_1184191 [Tanacetum coccineum]